MFLQNSKTPNFKTLRVCIALDSELSFWDCDPLEFYLLKSSQQVYSKLHVLLFVQLFRSISFLLDLIVAKPS